MKNTKFNVGDIVAMNPSSQYAYQAKDKNGEFVTGRVVDNNNGGNLIYEVEWENGNSNVYGDDDLLSLEGDYEIY